MNTDTLRLSIRDKLKHGRLPYNSIPRVWGGPGNNEVCDGCDQIVTQDQFVMEGISLAGGRRPLQVPARFPLRQFRSRFNTALGIEAQGSACSRNRRQRGGHGAVPRQPEALDGHGSNPRLCWRLRSDESHRRGGGPTKGARVFRQGKLANFYANFTTPFPCHPGAFDSEEGYVIAVAAFMDRAGLKLGDRIVIINDIAVQSRSDRTRALYAGSVGRPLEYGVQRLEAAA